MLLPAEVFRDKYISICSKLSREESSWNDRTSTEGRIPFHPLSCSWTHGSQYVGDICLPASISNSGVNIERATSLWNKKIPATLAMNISFGSFIFPNLYQNINSWNSPDIGSTMSSTKPTAKKATASKKPSAKNANVSKPIAKKTRVSKKAREVIERGGFFLSTKLSTLDLISYSDSSTRWYEDTDLESSHWASCKDPIKCRSPYINLYWPQVFPIIQKSFPSPRAGHRGPITKLERSSLSSRCWAIDGWRNDILC